MIIHSAITGDALLPLLTIAGPVAAGTYYFWQAPRDAQVKVYVRQVEQLETALARECDEHDRTRRKLALAYNTLVEAGIKLPTLETDYVIQPRPDPPRPG